MSAGGNRILVPFAVILSIGERSFECDDGIVDLALPSWICDSVGCLDADSAIYFGKTSLSRRRSM